MNQKNSHHERIMSEAAKAKQNRKMNTKRSFLALALGIVLCYGLFTMISYNKSNEWKLIVVNSDNPLPSDFTVTLSENNVYKIDSRIQNNLLRMMNDAYDDGVYLQILSSYRSVKTQNELLESTDDEVNKYIKSGGASEHHTGLAVDFGSDECNKISKEFENTKAFQWLLDNSYKYGFILRYPKDKEHITNTLYMPWHFRYVGSNNAKKMLKLNLCLEEFVKK